MRIKYLTAAAFALTACSSPTLPESTIQGVWGGLDLELRSHARSAEVVMTCRTASFPAIVPDQDGHFELEGEITTASAVSVGLGFRISGTVDGDMIDLEYSIELLEGGYPPLASVTLTRDTPGELTGSCVP